MSEEKDGRYCSVCGGIPPDEIKVRKILVDGKEVGIDQLDVVLAGVKRLGLTDDARIAEELVKRVQVFNYIPSKKREMYAAALLREYHSFLSEGEARNDA
ncbi:MAG: NAC family transcription factor [Methanobacteriota archaeon]|nr:MAG: NAC family transcription factor [Euryarchaeota archaeon]